jgi:Tripartite tricarboxylate transporter family receptor
MLTPPFGAPAKGVAFRQSKTGFRVPPTFRIEPGANFIAPRGLQGGPAIETRRRVLQFAGAAAAGPIAGARALDYPKRPVRVVVSWGPGGPTDVFARLVAPRLSDQLGRQFFVEYVPGGSGNIGAAQVARSAPDGHTLLFTVSAFVTNVAFNNKTPLRSGAGLRAGRGSRRLGDGDRGPPVARHRNP